MGLESDWYQPQLTVRTAALLPLSWIYRALACMNAAVQGSSQSVSATVPVIAIGNLTVGGTGKTPLTLALAEALMARGIAVGIVSRGYPASPAQPVVVDATSRAHDVGDEPLLYLRRNIPTVVCADRVRAAQKLLEIAPQVSTILADDAMQHRRLARALEICVVDSSRGFGNGKLLPAGPLREPVARLAHCDAVVVNGRAPENLAPHANRYLLQTEIAEIVAMSDGSAGIGALHDQSRRIALVAGIGNPQRFFAQMQAQHPAINFALTKAFPDHHAFVAEDLNHIAADIIVMTEKDAVRCREIAPQVSKALYWAKSRVTIEPAMIDWMIAALKAQNYGL